MAMDEGKKPQAPMRPPMATAMRAPGAGGQRPPVPGRLRPAGQANRPADLGQPVGAEPPDEPAPAQRPGAQKLTSRKLRNPVLALGLAVELLRGRPPFTRFRFGKFASVIKGQIRRGHYLFTFRGRMPVGYMGWAECTEAIARAWMEEGYNPTYKECMSGDSCVLITFVSPSKDVTFHQIRQSRLLYPDRPIYFMREYKDGRSRKSTVRNKIFKPS
jgi:hemolysin-activating ACP:hemolysin acyltransferase